ncbi:MAG: tetrahydromethanopterin S-methyltransferase subunit A [Candidatus Marinimicrobia bacterium]|nr:tetrahydromethanopterin S-methyltransferase subunit A [Candidatus Neomarinimicrobiota bacterium]
MKPNPSEILKIYKPENDKLSLEELFEDLEQIFKIKKCSLCGCNANTLQEFETVARQHGQPALAEKAKILREVVTKNKRYECINCNPCYSADIANSLFEMEYKQNGKVNFLNSSSCSSDYAMEKLNTWPVEKGEYFVGNEKSAVAVCTLASTELPKLIYSEMRKKIAIVGYCETENIGVEKVVKNIITNSNIRYLILCGNEGGMEMMGHFAGQAILSLHANGISDNGRIIGAKGKRPILKNIDSQQIQRFQSQFEVINLINTNSVQEIGKTINLCLSDNNHNYDSNSVTLDSKKLIVAKKPKRLVLDKKGFFVILPQQKENKVYVEYYANSGQLLHTIVGTDAPRIYNTIIEKGFISKLDHAAYLGKELIKAEYNLKYDIPYIQDKAL